MTSYRGKITYLLPILSFPALFTLAAAMSGEISDSWGFFAGLWILCLFSVFISLGFKLKIDGNHVEETFLGISIKKLTSTSIESISEGKVSLFEFVNPIFLLAITHGQGLVLLANIRGVRKVYSFSEKLYGKEVIANIKVAFGK